MAFGYPRAFGKPKINLMKFTTFWGHLLKGGITPEGDKYSVVSGDRLHIQSPGNTNPTYYIRKKTVEKYFSIDIQAMSETEFRIKRSSYFYNIYRHIV
jgi:hypothetical protein